jgi:hypothetical protein
MNTDKKTFKFSLIGYDTNDDHKMSFSQNFQDYLNAHNRLLELSKEYPHMKYFIEYNSNLDLSTLLDTSKLLEIMYN